MRAASIILMFLAFTNISYAQERYSPPSQGTMPLEWADVLYPREQIQNTFGTFYRKIGHIVSNRGTCTGTLIGPRHVLTAAHCVYSTKDQAWARDIKFYPGRFAERSLPYGVASWERIYIPRSYHEILTADHTLDLEYSYDYAVIVLKENLGDRVGWMGMKSISEPPKSVVITGYPGDKTSGTLWNVTCPGAFYPHEESQFQFECETYGGMSGSGIRDVDSPNSENIVGVLDWGNKTTKKAGGVVFIPAVFDHIRNMVDGNLENSRMTTNTDETVTFYLKNACPKALTINNAFLYHSLDDQWVQNTNWLNINYDETVKIGTSDENFFYHYGQYITKNEKTVWGKNDGVIIILGESVFSEKVTVSDDVKKKGVMIRKLICN